MELIESFTRQDADLGSTFISEKEVTIKLNGEDLKNLLAFQQIQSENIATKGGKIANCSHFMTEEEFETIQELLGIVLEGVSDYDLV
jgi:hypothetical protein|tara:strand:- start:2296 stop:2556 length:261 start_codon:yes stop_codon:yes gene_type:complete